MNMKKLKQSFLLHRIHFVFEFADVKIKRRKFSIIVPFAATVHKAQGQTLKNDTWLSSQLFFSLDQVYIRLLRDRTSDDVLLLHILDEAFLNAQDFHPMPLSIKNPVLNEAAEFMEGRL